MWKRAKSEPAATSETLRPGRSRRWRRLAWLAVPLLAAAWLYWSTGSEIQLAAPPSTHLFEDRHGVFLAESERGPLGFWDVDDYNRVATALLAIEDHRFHSHDGVDGRSLLRALVRNLSGGPREGASTIAMQVARLQQPRPRTYLNKLREMIVAYRLTRRFGREAVLRHYLKIVPMGNRMHGVAYAARRYFRKPLADLTWAEAALLAALPKAPGDFNLYRTMGRKRALARAELVLDLLKQQGPIEAGAYRVAMDQLAHLQLPQKEVRPFQSMHAILRLEAMVDDTPPRQRPMRTTLDMNLQSEVDRLAHLSIQHLRGYGAGNIAVLVADHSNGDILAYLGSDFYDDSSHAGAIDYVQVPRSAGSTIKPFIYAYGLERKLFGPASVLPDLPLNITSEDGHYSPTNYDASYLGPMLYRQALANSRNIPALLVLREAGLQNIYDHLKQAGLTDNARGPSHYGLGLAIGGLYVTLEDLVTAYGAFPNQGLPLQLRWFQQPTNTAADEPGARRLYSQETARQINQFLSDRQARLPSFPRGGAMHTLLPVALKTGTSQGFRDAWCVAYSHRYLVGVWIGRPDHGRTNHISGSQSAKLAIQILEHLHPEEAKGIGDQPFPPPQDAVAVKLCAMTGDLAGPLCPTPVLEQLLPHQMPTAITDAHIRLAIDQRSGLRAAPDTPSEHRLDRTFTRLPPIYRAWLHHNGLTAPPPRAGQQASIRIAAPADGARYILDPNTPRAFQTLALRAAVYPDIPHIHWTINGQPLDQAGQTGQTRWQLQPGTHTIQASFPNADIQSQPVTITVQQ